MSTSPEDKSTRPPRRSRRPATVRSNWDDWLTRDWIGPKASARARQGRYDPLTGPQARKTVRTPMTTGQVQAWLLGRSYYRALNVDNRFRAELRGLAAAAAKAKTPAVRRRLVQGFATDWCLPTTFGVRDIEWSLGPAQPAARRALMVGPRPIGVAADAERLKSLNLPLPLRWRSDEYAAALGQRIYRKTVLGWSWDRITDAEGGERKDAPIDASGVRKTTVAAARFLRIPLRRLRPGRPRKN